jgi:hypothetical protein
LRSLHRCTPLKLIKNEKGVYVLSLGRIPVPWKACLARKGASTRIEHSVGPLWVSEKLMVFIQNLLDELIGSWTLKSIPRSCSIGPLELIPK